MESSTSIDGMFEKDFLFYVHWLCELGLYVMGGLIAAFDEHSLMLFVVTPIIFQMFYWIMAYRRAKKRIIPVLLCDLLICILPARDFFGMIGEDGVKSVTSPGTLAIFICLAGVVSFWISVARNKGQRNI